MPITSRIIVTLFLSLVFSSLYARSGDPIRIVTFGNSITAERKTIKKVFSQRLPELLAQKGIQAVVINSGVGGSHSGRAIDNQPTNKIKHAQDRFQEQVLDQHPDLVIIGFGANDAYIDSKKAGDPSRLSIDQFRNNMRFMIETLQARGTKVILMGTNGYRPGDRDFLHDRLLEYLAEAKKLSIRYKTGFVNNQATFEKFEKTTGQSAAVLFEDQLHPNDEGHKLIAESLTPEIARVIAQKPLRKTNILVTKDEYGAPEIVKNSAQWNQYRSGVQKKMESVMGKLPDTGLSPPDFEVVDTLHTPSYLRMNVRILAAPGEIVTAYLYKPTGSPGKHPAMLALHETDMPGKKSVDGEGSYEKSRQNLGYGKELTERGYVVLAPDYPSFGESAPYDFKNDRYQSGTMKGIFNHMRCIDLLEKLDFVDKDRIGAIGHSLGGHNAMFLAAFDQRVKVTVSSCGWTLLDYYDIGPAASEQYGGRLGPFAQERYMPLWEKYGLDGNKKPFEFHQLILAIAPRAFFSSSPTDDKNFDVKGVREGIQLAQTGYNFLKAGELLQARYPNSGHEFPEATRKEAYQFIDRILLKNQQSD